MVTFNSIANISEEEWTEEMSLTTEGENEVN